MDIKAKITEIAGKIKNDKTLLSNFKTNPIATIEKLIGVDLPDETVQKLVDGVKAALASGDIKDKLDADGDGKLDLNDAKAALGGLFGKLKK
ncbi:MAG: hypothetical protein HFE63_04645 [Clostridiales bacterium]|nr:hypothetical protein [Clostridiales bacterium]